MTTDNNKKITKLIEKLLQELGEDPTREGLLRTPARVAKSWDCSEHQHGWPSPGDIFPVVIIRIWMM